MHFISGVTPRALHPDVYTPEVNVDQQEDEKRHKTVPSAPMPRYVLLFYYWPTATVRSPQAHAKFRTLRLQTAWKEAWIFPPFPLPILEQLPVSGTVWKQLCKRVIRLHYHFQICPPLLPTPKQIEPKNFVFWDVAPCVWVLLEQKIHRNYRLHLQVIESEQQETNVYLDCLTQSIVTTNFVPSL
jgi:hypothetical protein